MKRNNEIKKKLAYSGMIFLGLMLLILRFIPLFKLGDSESLWSLQKIVNVCSVTFIKLFMPICSSINMINVIVWLLIIVSTSVGFYKLCKTTHK